ncbi:hypothetical protein L798_09173 [Zootermopsis nevadensis]|uniref:Uncharacterized protein n=1 Tax=Zootermopsis nevadensis TaxID=136037 RepID=A0A067QYP2_ZOONE|nr:hypothetical protein L798_09173 [Zootermopsis nevadensis]
MELVYLTEFAFIKALDNRQVTNLGNEITTDINTEELTAGSARLQRVRCDKPDDTHLRTHHHENVKSQQLQCERRRLFLKRCKRTSSATLEVGTSLHLSFFIKFTNA